MTEKLNTSHPYVQFPRNVRLSHRRIANFSPFFFRRIVTLLIIAPYKYSNLLTYSLINFFYYTV